MKRNILIVALVLALIAVIIVLITYIFHEEKDKGLLTLYGNVDVRQVDIGFRVPGQVTELRFEEGDFVTQGTLMTKLDLTPYDSQLNEAVANFEAVKVNLENLKKIFPSNRTILIQRLKLQRNF